MLYARHRFGCATPLLARCKRGMEFVVALRKRAEAVLLDMRCHSSDARRANDAFAAAAEAFSNCPSSDSGGDLGWLSAGVARRSICMGIDCRVRTGYTQR